MILKLDWVVPAFIIAASLFQGTGSGQTSECHIDEAIFGTATHVGHAYYPWKETVALRKTWGQIEEDWKLPTDTHMAALHEAMVDPKYFGRRALVISRETGSSAYVYIVDAMAAGKRHSNPHYWNRVIDLSPQVFNYLLQDPYGKRGGQSVMVVFSNCDRQEWTRYAVG